MSDRTIVQRRRGGGIAISTGSGESVLLDAAEVSALVSWLIAARSAAVTPAKARFVRCAG